MNSNEPHLSEKVCGNLDRDVGVSWRYQVASDNKTPRVRRFNFIYGLEESKQRALTMGSRNNTVN